MPIRPHIERNDRSRLRLQQVIDELADDQLTGTTDGPWTIGVLLAHMAFWDRFVKERWEHAFRSQQPTPVLLDLSLADLVNDASVPGWSLIPPQGAARMALAAADEVDGVIAALTNDAVEALLAAGWNSLLDRSVHRHEHLDAIERQVSAPASP
jgi:hypothetical protein